MTEPSENYLRVRDYAGRLSLDESTVCKMIERGEIGAIRIGKKALRIPSSDLERHLERGPASEPDAAALGRRAETFREKTGKDPGAFVEAWRKGAIEDTPENSEVAIRGARAAQRAGASSGSRVARDALILRESSANILAE